MESKHWKHWHIVFVTFCVIGIGIVVVIADLNKPDRPSDYEQFVTAVLEKSPEWDHAFVAEGTYTIDVWGYDQGHRCSSDHILEIVTYAIYQDGTGEFVNDFNMRHLSLGHKADPKLIALNEEIRRLECTTPCHSHNELDAWEEAIPLPELKPCTLMLKDGELVVEQIDRDQLEW